MSQDNPNRLPIKIDSTSNGEFRPVGIGKTLTRMKALAARRIGDNARAIGVSRRAFLNGLCGAATTLATFNSAFAARGNTGGRFELPAEASFEPAAAAVLGGDEFILDVQTHMIEPQGAWRARGRRWEAILDWFPQGACGEADPVDCYSAEHFIKEVFLDSDTTAAVMSFVPGPPERNPLSLQEAARVRDLVAALGNGRRLLLHAMVMPNLKPLQAQLDAMERAAAEWGIAAWKCYTQWGPDRLGWALDDPAVGIPFIEQARQLGVPNICIHKGFSLPSQSPQFADCADVGRAAKLFPDVNFIIYHSGFEANRRELAYDPARATRGIDSLVKSLIDNGIQPDANVYAELGSTWRFLMRDPTAAAHALGKLMKYVGRTRVVWGTDSIWYGSPQDQIQAFRAFQIAEALQERHGYPALTPALKRQVFGLNGAAVYGLDPATLKKKAAADPLGAAKAAYLEAPEPSFATYGPKTLRAFAQLERARGGWPT